MSQLTFTQIPGFFDIADSAIAGGQPLTDDAIAKISHNAKFGSVRCEVIYMGFYSNGATVATPPSPVDGYAYSRAEVTYLWQVYSTRPPAVGFVQGQQGAPGISGTPGGAGQVLWTQFDINDATGVVTCKVSYFVSGGAETPTTDGIVKVYAICQRSSANVSN